MVIIKTEDDIKKIKEACRIWKIAREAIIKEAKVGSTLLELDALADRVITENGGTSAFYQYLGFKGHICISVNDCVIHGVPTDYVIKENDKVTFDVGVKYMDHYCDAAFTIIFGNNVEAKNISDVCLESLNRAIKMIRPGINTKEISKTIQNYVEGQGYYILRDFCGHGCGNNIHEDPMIFNYRSMFAPSVILEPNMVICIEPMILKGSNQYFIDPLDHWSVKSKNKEITCHWEHMILVTDDGCLVLTE